MNEEDLIKFLKENLKIDFHIDGYGETWTNYTIKLILKREEICSTSFSIFDSVYL